MYYAIGASVPSLHRESTDSLILYNVYRVVQCYVWFVYIYTSFPRYGHLNVVGYLVTEAHCDPNVKDNTGWTPLHYACR